MDEIILFDEYPHDHQQYKNQNTKILNIIFRGGTYGNFLKFFLDKFSQLTPDLTGSPFTEIGTSHKKIKYSGLIERHHEHFVDQNKNKTNLPICLILPTEEKDFLFLKKSMWFRAGDTLYSPDDLWIKNISSLGEEKPYHKSLFKKITDQICSLYQLELKNDKIPKFIIRDWYKLEFLEKLEKTYNYRWFASFKNHFFFQKQKTQYFPLGSFFNYDDFMKNIKILDNIFEIKLDFNKIDEMKDIFMQGYDLDQQRKEINFVFDIIDNLSKDINLKISKLDVASEAFIYAYIEKKYPFVKMPLTNYFFKDTEEIKEYFTNYPNWYKIS
jgi:hypothetical protein